jgi:inner membrane protein
MDAIIIFLALSVVIVALVSLVFLCVFLWKKIRHSTPNESPNKEPDFLEKTNPNADTPEKISPTALKNKNLPHFLDYSLTGLFILLTLIPLNFLQSLVSERYQNYLSIQESISREWGYSQTFTAPLLVVPYIITYDKEEKIPTSIADGDETAKTFRTVIQTINEKRVAYIAPEDLNIFGTLKPEFRSRGIYNTLVFTASLKIDGFFPVVNFNHLDNNITRILWEESRFLVGLSEPKSVKKVSLLNINDKTYSFASGGLEPGLIQSGFSSELQTLGEDPLHFSFELDSTASNQILFAPLGNQNSITLDSPWPHPSFVGDGLPQERHIWVEGFSAIWFVPSLVRNYPQFGISSSFRESQTTSEQTYSSHDQVPTPFSEYLVGVSLVNPVDHYALITRAVKFAILFIVLTFLGFIIVETSLPEKNHLHIAQIALIDIALALFYLVLLALSEHYVFWVSYLVASLVNIIMISGYIYLSSKKLNKTLWMTAILTFLYVMLYTILNLEDYALISGTAILVFILGILMFKTRKLTN